MSDQVQALASFAFRDAPPIFLRRPEHVRVTSSANNHTFDQAFDAVGQMQRASEEGYRINKAPEERMLCGLHHCGDVILIERKDRTHQAIVRVTDGDRTCLRNSCHLTVNKHSSHDIC